MAKYPEFSQWLEQQYIDWQRREGCRKTATEFAAWLGIGNATVNQWLNGDARPRPEFAFKLAKCLGLEVYDRLALPRPDPLLFQLQCNWDKFTDKERATIGKILGQWRRKYKTRPAH